MSDSKFSSAEENYIKQEVDKYQASARQAAIEAEIRNRILNAQSEQPGYKYGT